MGPIIPISETPAGTQSGAEPSHEEVRVAAERPLPKPIYGFDWKRDGKLLLHYLLESEVHTFAFSVAANAILSFLPFIVLLYTFANGVFRSPAMASVIGDMVNYFFPANQVFVAQAMDGVATRQGVQAFSMLMVLVSCTGIFLPLEVALNRSWGVRVSRNYFLNQLVAFGLAAWMVVLGLGSIVLNSAARALLTLMFFGHVDNLAFRIFSEAWLVVTTAVASILFFFSIYWLLPNCKVPWRPVLRVAIVTGLLWVGAKYVYAAALPYLKLRTLYGPFYVSVGLLLWAYVTGLLLFAGALVSAMRFNSRTDPEG